MKLVNRVARPGWWRRVGSNHRQHDYESSCRLSFTVATSSRRALWAQYPRTGPGFVSEESVPASEGLVPATGDPGDALSEPLTGPRLGSLKFRVNTGAATQT